MIRVPVTAPLNVSVLRLLSSPEIRTFDFFFIKKKKKKKKEKNSYGVVCFYLGWKSPESFNKLRREGH